MAKVVFQPKVALVSQNLPELRHAVNDLIRESKQENGEYIIDLSNTDMIDSTGLSILIMLHKEVGAKKIKKANEKVREVLEVTGMFTLFEY